MACSVWVTSLRGSETWDGGETSGVGDLFGAGQHKRRKDGWRIKTAGSRDPERQQQQQQQRQAGVGQQMGQGVEVVRNGCHGHGKGRYKEWTGAEIMEDVLRALPELRDKSTRRRTGSGRPFLALTEVRVQVLSWRGSKGANRAGRDTSTEQSTGPAWVAVLSTGRRVRKEGGERGRRKAGRTRAASHDGDTRSLSLATIGVERPGRKRKRRRPGRRTQAQVITNVSVNVHFLSACPSLVCECRDSAVTSWASPCMYTSACRDTCLIAPALQTRGSISFRLSVTYLPPESALERSVHATMFDAVCFTREGYFLGHQTQGKKDANQATSPQPPMRFAKHMKVRMVGGQCSWIFHPCR
ncbi:hypothetical protein GE21DRAFT_9333 [Neurospora crassa]|uniref:Uncharacterized protein n=1 Tax=Neurospora crassa (strain ATCC 24698 / 74-OR23-1A / CBS 708.71 / DSM 1257 / FGSC 987) TaxID=367110 RepID=Q7S2F6_NEUCR|nr:hypothetical protein NCU06000 [Neurospora crassa OR74A]EAA29572.1 hypothetical protein NCU06000 [Neurospora crassa OR74A]KHE87446.1 hypothetical protein GE21DRAFT_9333 [Neurospora crassa]|eukprot:XP_958808.1 hypothetical protein NCU06000 [Neurospora crassa OR74A]